MCWFHFNGFKFFIFSSHLATEIRCQEKSKGGLCYEVILGQPVAIPKQIKSAPIAKKVSAAEIERKLSEAEKRRLVSKFTQFNCTDFFFIMTILNLIFLL